MTTSKTRIIAAAGLLAGLAIQTVAATQAHAVEPIPGSITYGGQPRAKLQKSPVGSTVSHRVYSNGTSYEETYRLREDRSLKLIDRRRVGNR